MTHLDILTDYLASNNIKFDIRHYPWQIIRDTFNTNYPDHVRNRRVFYTSINNIGTPKIKESSTSNNKCNAEMYTRLCGLIWEHNKVSNEKWDSGLINPNSTVIELNEILNLIYTGKYSTYKQ